MQDTVGKKSINRLEGKVMKKALIIIAVICVVILIIVLGVKFVFHPEISKELKKVKKLISRHYPEGKILDLKLRYVDWSSTIRDIEDDDIFYNRPTRALATIQSGSEEYVIELERGLLFWHITNDNSKSGVEAKGIEYYATIHGNSVGSAVDMDDWCNSNWVIPQDDGSLYKSVDDTEIGGIKYYSVMICDGLYVVENKKIQQLSKYDKDWTESEYSYSDLKRYGNFRQVTEEEYNYILSLKPQK